MVGKNRASLEATQELIAIVARTVETRYATEMSTGRSLRRRSAVVGEPGVLWGPVPADIFGPLHSSPMR